MKINARLLSKNENYVFEFGKGIVLNKGEKVAIVATGSMVQESMKAKDMMNINPTVVNMHTIKPIDKELIIELAKTHKYMIAAEEHSIIGGLYSAIAEVKAKSDVATPLIPIGINDTFGESGHAKDVLEKYGLTAAHIIEVVNK